MRVSMFFLASDADSHVDVTAIDRLPIRMPTRLYGSFDEAWRDGVRMGHDPVRIGMVRVDMLATELAEITEVTSEEALLEAEVDIARIVIEQHERRVEKDNAERALRHEQHDYRLADIDEERTPADDAVDAVAHTTILHSSQREDIMQSIIDTAAILDGASRELPVVGRVDGSVRLTETNMVGRWGEINSSHIADAAISSSSARTNTHCISTATPPRAMNDYVRSLRSTSPMVQAWTPRMTIIDRNTEEVWRIEDDGGLSTDQLMTALDMVHNGTTSSTARDTYNRTASIYLMGINTARDPNTMRTIMSGVVQVGDVHRFTLSHD